MIKKIYFPILFQGNLNKKNYFEGWYYKLVNKDKTISLSFIPGINLNSSDSHCFIQYILVEKEAIKSNTTTGYCKYDLGDFNTNYEPFSVTVKNSTFTEHSIDIDFQDNSLSLRGNIKLKNITPISSSFIMPNIMGIFAYIPNMECNHGVISMNHNLLGNIHINDRKIDFSGGKGYLEKDWGSSFPKHYIWLQCNHFDDESISLFFSIAHIPLHRLEFEGFICNIIINNKEYRFASYNLSKCKVIDISLNHCKIILENKVSKLEIFGNITDQGNLIAPIKGKMNKSIKEGISGRIIINFTDKLSKKSYTHFGENAGIEIVDY